MSYRLGSQCGFRNVMKLGLQL